MSNGLSDHKSLNSSKIPPIFNENLLTADYRKRESFRNQRQLTEWLKNVEVLHPYTPKVCPSLPVELIYLKRVDCQGGYIALHTKKLGQ